MDFNDDDELINLTSLPLDIESTSSHPSLFTSMPPGTQVEPVPRLSIAVSSASTGINSNRGRPPIPRPVNAHFAWGIYKKTNTKTKERRPTCKPYSCKRDHYDYHDNPPSSNALVAVGANGGERKKRDMKRTIKNKYSKKSKSNNRHRYKDRKTKKRR